LENGKGFKGMSQATKYIPVSVELYNSIVHHFGSHVSPTSIVENSIREYLGSRSLAGGREGSTAVENSPLISADLEQRIRVILDKYWGGKLYMKIPHPAFDGWPATYGYERWDVIKPHLAGLSGKALDIGAHFGSFSHLLEETGFDVTSVEICPHHAQIMSDIRDLANRRFQVVNASIFDLAEAQFDLVFAMNVFHHFLKKEVDYQGLIAFLNRLQCRAFIFQSHDPGESQMEGAFINFHPQEFAEFVMRHSGLSQIQCIRDSEIRKIYKIT